MHKQQILFDILRLKFTQLIAFLLLFVANTLQAVRAHSVVAPSEQIAPGMGRLHFGNPEPAKGDTHLFLPDFVTALMRKANDYQIAHPVLKEANRDWERGTWLTGVMAAYSGTGDRKYLDQATTWAREQQWRPGRERAGANVLTCCQTYLELYFLTTNRAFIEPTIQWLDSARSNTPSGARIWYLENNLRYADALYVGAPGLAMLAKATGDHKYLDWMNAFFGDVQQELLDKEAGLFYRDKRFIGEKSPNGKKIFWSRGNGWVFASLPRILANLPKDDPARAKYESLFKQMAAALVQRQPSDGLWRPNLDDAQEFPMPETSGTGFFCYGLAWGVRNGLLDANTYSPAIQKAWIGLAKSVSPDGKVQWGQLVGYHPVAVKQDDSHEYVTGAFLLAGSEVLRLAKHGMIGEQHSEAAGAKPCDFDHIPRPRVLVTAARLEYLRNDIRTNAVRRAIYKKDIKINADRWLRRTIVIPEQGGWGHDFCGPDGVLLELPAEQKFNPKKPSRSPSTGKNYLSSKIVAARHYFEHTWLSFAVRDLALAGVIEQRAKYARKAAEILLKYADGYPRIIAETNGFGFQRMSLPEAVSLIPMAQGYDLIYNSGALNDEEKRHIEKDFFWPEAQRLSQAGLGGNWGSWHLSAVGVIGYATGHQRFADYGVDNFKSQIANQLGDDGLWPESAHCYHFYPLDGFLSLAEAAGNCGTDLFHWQAKPGKGLEAMFESPLRYMYPTLQLPAINDGWYDAFLPQDQYTVAYWHYHEPEFAWALRRSEEVGRSGLKGEFYDQRYRLFLFGEKLPDRTPAPMLSSTNFPGLGIAILRQGSDVPIDREMFMTFHYGQFSGHGHFDKMGITLFANGSPLAPGLGTPGYGSPNIRFFGGVTAHNTIALDEKNQPRTTDSHLIAFRDEPQAKLAVAETSQLAPDTKWIRAVLLADNYAVVWDDLRSGREHTCDWFFHAVGDKLLLSGVSTNGPADTGGSGEFPYPFISGGRAQPIIGSEAQATWSSSKQMGLKIWMMSDTNDWLFSAHCPTTDGKTIPLIALRKHSKECQFVNVLRPWKGTPEKWQIHADRSDPANLRLVITEPARTDVISFNFSRIEFDFSSGRPDAKQFDVPLASATNAPSSPAN